MKSIQIATWQGDPLVLPVGAMVNVLATHGTSAWVKQVRGRFEAPRYRSCELSDLGIIYSAAHEGSAVGDTFSQDVEYAATIRNDVCQDDGVITFDPPLIIPRGMKVIVDMEGVDVTFSNDDESNEDTSRIIWR